MFTTIYLHKPTGRVQQLISTRVGPLSLLCHHEHDGKAHVYNRVYVTCSRKDAAKVTSAVRICYKGE